MGNNHSRKQPITTILNPSQYNLTDNEEIAVYSPKSLTNVTPHLCFSIRLECIRTMDISNSKVSEITSLPFGLVVFNCERNVLTTIPLLPNTLETLNCADNKITGTLYLNQHLKTLNCANNKITGIATASTTMTTTKDVIVTNSDVYANVTPENMIELNCHTNKLTTLPVLNNGIVHLYCENADLTKMPKLPLSLKWCDFTIIKTHKTVEIYWSGLTVNIDDATIKKYNTFN
jgi:hypothetical protein